MVEEAEVATSATGAMVGITVGKVKADGQARFSSSISCWLTESMHDTHSPKFLCRRDERRQDERRNGGILQGAKDRARGGVAQVPEACPWELAVRVFFLQGMLRGPVCRVHACES